VAGDDISSSQRIEAGPKRTGGGGEGKNAFTLRP